MSKISRRTGSGSLGMKRARKSRRTVVRSHTMKIEWASDFHSDGTRRSRPRPSGMHGWLAKMRGTLIGDEKLRSRGMREIREAKALRKWEKENKNKKNAFRPQRQSGGFFSFFSSSKKPARRPTLHRSSTSASKRPQPPSRHSSRSTPQRGPSRSSRGPQQHQQHQHHRGATRRGTARGGTPARQGTRPSVRR
ncbi:ribonuclease H-like protein [Moniliophthora roreri]|nr:ribonuclease H-like protein [Moniliophthora roreri]